MSHEVRLLAAPDLPAARTVIAATGLFPPDMLDDMVAPFLTGTAEEFWCVAGAGAPHGLAYCAPERMTSGTWNMLLIAVHPERQRRGTGAALIGEIERMLRERAARIVLVETSSLPEYNGTRGFYRRRGFEEEARIRGFYADGEDKIVFRKAMHTRP